MAERKNTLAPPREAPGAGPWRQNVDDPAPPALMPVGAIAQTGQTDFITARQVTVPRRKRMAEILQQCDAEAHANGDFFYYRIPYKDRQKNTTTYVEGPSIKLANALARIYGNCVVRCTVEDHGDRWVFNAQFTDLETGFTLERPHPQRKQQNTGMRDAERQLDQVFAIGVSKAQRNVIVNAVPDLANRMFEKAKQSLAHKIGENFEAAWNHYGGMIDALGIPIERIERIYGMPYKRFKVPQLAKLHTELNAVEEGWLDPDDIWPDNDDDIEQMERAQQREAAVDLTDETDAPAPAPAPKQQKGKGNASKAGGAKGQQGSRAAGDEPAERQATGRGAGGSAAPAPAPASGRQRGEDQEDDAPVDDDAREDATPAGDDAPPEHSPAEPSDAADDVSDAPADGPADDDPAFDFDD